MRQMNTIELGLFEIESGRMIVSDPCYTADLWCCNTIDHVRCGTWLAEVDVLGEGEYGRRIAALRAQTVMQPKKLPAPENAPFEVGVDSGQAGLFDALYYRNSDMIRRLTGFESDDPDLWYAYCCKVTLSQMHAGVIPFGIVSSSGYGDGAYACRIYRDQAGEAFRIEVIFIDSEKEEAEKYEED